MITPEKKFNSLPERSKENLSKTSQSPKPAPKPAEDIFGKDEKIPAQELIQKFRKASSHIPGAGGAVYNLAEREKLAREITKQYGSDFEKKRFEDTKMFRDLSQQRYNAKSSAERLAKDRKIRWLKEQIKGKGK